MEIGGGSLVELRGFDELLERLDELPRDLGSKRKIIVRALRAGIKPIHEEAKSRSPKGSMSNWVGVRTSAASRKYGPLITNIKATVLEPSAEGAEGQVGITSHGFYGRFAETGTKHQRKRAWLGPAYDSKIGEALDTVATVLDEGIQSSFYG